jgi:hypothetical protein
MFNFEDRMSDLWRIPIKIQVIPITSLEWVQQLYDSSVQLHHFVKVNKVQSFGFLFLVPNNMLLDHH